MSYIPWWQTPFGQLLSSLFALSPLINMALLIAILVYVVKIYKKINN